MIQPIDIKIGDKTLAAVLEEHRDWLDLNGDQRANLQDANLQDADLQGANLRGAYLRGANLQGANLQDANLQDANLQDANLQDANLQDADLDFSCLPLWCGSFRVKCSRALVVQLAGHIAALAVQDATEEDLRFAEACRTYATKWEHKLDKWPEWVRKES